MKNIEITLTFLNQIYGLYKAWHKAVYNDRLEQYCNTIYLHRLEMLLSKFDDIRTRDLIDALIIYKYHKQLTMSDICRALEALGFKIVK